MSKITFRANEDLIKQLEGFEASKSEVMREALREYLEGSESGGDADEQPDGALADRIDDLIAESVDDVIEDRVEDVYSSRPPQDVNVNITLDGDSASATDGSNEDRKTPTLERENPADDSHVCKQCGETLSPSAVYCSNCGEKASQRAFCDCGDELRSDWRFCPSCGSQTPAADVLRDP